MYKFKLTYDEWKSIIKKTRKGVECHSDSFNGYISILNADEVSEKQSWEK